jgi:hypothetical protein
MYVRKFVSDYGGVDMEDVGIFIFYFCVPDLVCV